MVACIGCIGFVIFYLLKHSFHHNSDGNVICRNYQGSLFTEKGKTTKEGAKVIMITSFTNHDQWVK